MARSRRDFVDNRNKGVWQVANKNKRNGGIKMQENSITGEKDSLLPKQVERIPISKIIPMDVEKRYRSLSLTNEFGPIWPKEIEDDR